MSFFLNDYFSAAGALSSTIMLCRFGGLCEYMDQPACRISLCDYLSMISLICQSTSVKVRNVYKHTQYSCVYFKDGTGAQGLTTSSEVHRCLKST